MCYPRTVVLLLALVSSLVPQTLARAGSLIDTLEKGDVTHVADDNNGRMDLLSVLLAASHAKCEDVVAPGFAKLATYVAYLGSDSVTGKYPSGEFAARGLISAVLSNDSQPSQENNVDAPWLLNPNAAAMLALGARGCRNPRYQTVLTNLFEAMDHHIAWHDQNLGTRAPLMQQQVRPVRAADFRASIEQEVELPAQPAATRQVTDLETRRATYLDCVYGPLNPDGTGSTTFDFWNATVPMPGGEFLKVSRKHPLAKFGDVALPKCPVTLPEARQRINESRRTAEANAGASTLPPVPVNLQLMMGQYYPNYLYVKQSWLAYQKTHNPADLQHAIDTKAILLRTYARSCGVQKSAPGGQTSMFCELSNQLTTEFAEIPDGPTSSAVPKPVNQDLLMQSMPSNAPRPGPVQPQQRGDIPAGTQLVVTTSQAIDFTRPGTYHGRLAQPVQSGGQVIAAAQSEVLLTVSEPKTQGAMVYAELTVDTITAGGKTLPVMSQPMMRSISANGRATGGTTARANSTLVFTSR
jgi:hypothetical protein